MLTNLPRNSETVVVTITLMQCNYTSVRNNAHNYNKITRCNLGITCVAMVLWLNYIWEAEQPYEI